MKSTILLLFTLAFVVSLSQSIRAQASDASAGERKAIEQTMLDYFAASRKKDRKAIRRLITRTPPQYWEPETPRTSKPDENEDAPSTKPLDDAFYEFVEDGFTLPVKEVGKVEINGRFARVRLMLDIPGNSALRTTAFLLVKERGVWKIFSHSDYFPRMFP